MSYCTSCIARHLLPQEAIRLREKKLAEEVFAVSMGPKQCQVGAFALFPLPLFCLERPCGRAAFTQGHGKVLL